ncbi:MAG TPA: hypothetical protein VKV33_05620 [Streptosporangiaceae bacterium]|nr:hypothetical protein [Streptosporangiaceae bacterium]
MGFFRKRTPGQPSPATPIGPLNDAQLRRADELMDQFSRAVGDDTALRAVCAAIRAEAGVTDATDLLARGTQNTDVAWRWLCAAAVAAAGRGGNRLPAQVFACAFVWNTSVAPRLESGDLAGLCLPAVPREIEARLAAVALPCLLALPSGLLIMDCRSGQLRAGDLALIAAQKLANLYGADPAVTREVLRLGQDMLAGKVAHGGADGPGTPEPGTPEPGTPGSRTPGPRTPERGI